MHTVVSCRLQVWFVCDLFAAWLVCGEFVGVERPCSVLQMVAGCCGMMQSAEVRCSVLQSVAVCCSVLRLLGC